MPEILKYRKRIIGDCTLILGNCLAYIPTLPWHSVDLLLTDPPYGIGYRTNYRYATDSPAMIYGDSCLTTFQRMVEAISGKLSRDGAAYCFCSPKNIDSVLPIVSRLWRVKNLLVWDKGNWGAGDLTSAYGCQYELIVYAAKGVGPPLKKRGGDILKCGRVTDWSRQGKGSGPAHPNQKPDKLLTQLIENSTQEGDLVVDPFMGCYDDKTEVLTRRGWSRFSTLTDDDEFLTRDPSGSLSYQSATASFKYRYRGKMVSIKSRSTDLLVTPSHNMLVQSHADFCAGRPASLTPAKNLTKSCYRIPCGGSYTSEKFDLTREMMYLIGLYVSEGYISHRDKLVNICQNQGAKWDEMRKQLGYLVDPKSYSGRKFSVKLPPGGISFLMENCGEGKYSKFLSPLILANSHLKSLFNAMLLGDGNRNVRHGQIQYYTASNQLAGNFQELCVKLGVDSSMRCRDRGVSVIQGRSCQTQTNYVISVRAARSKKVLKHHIKQVNYDGSVYCVTVPNHVLLVRRSGYVSWCGNSGRVGICCARLGRRFIGCEIDPSFYQQSVASIAWEYTKLGHDSHTPNKFSEGAEL